METLKLEVGKIYRSRVGEEVKIVRTSDSELWPFVGDNGKTYSKSGSHWYIELPDDLIEELPETRHTRRSTTFVGCLKKGRQAVEPRNYAGGGYTGNLPHT